MLGMLGRCVRPDSFLVAFVVTFVGAALPPSMARADVLAPGTRFVEPHAILLAGRFDDYCDHRATIAAGDTFESLARAAYGDPARAADLAKANPELAATKLAIGTKVVLPAKKAPPADAKETLAWHFYAWSRLSPPTQPQRVFPGEDWEAPGKTTVLVAFPAARAAEFAQLCGEKIHKKDRKELEALAPWIVRCDGLSLQHAISDRIHAAKSTTTYSIEELGVDAQGAPRFKVKPEGTTYVDEKGAEVKAGLAGAAPLLLISLAGAAGLLMMFRRRRAARTASAG